MKSIKFLIVILLSNQVIAQITIDANDFINGSDTVLVSAVSNYQNINYQTSGANSVWDFTNVIIDSQRVDTYGAVSSAGLLYQLTFNNQFLAPDYRASYFLPAGEGLLPTGILPITIENPVIFEKISNAAFERVGLGLEIGGIGLPIQADPIDIVFKFPMNYQDSWTDTSGLFADLNPAFDATFKRQQIRSLSVDGYGTISTAYGTFDCIRVKTDIIYNDSILFDLFGTGATWFPVPTAAETQYRWIAKNQKIPVMTIDLSNGFGGTQITKVEFRDSKGVASIDGTNPLQSITLFPNPAQDHLNISNLKGDEAITITNLTGQVLFNSNASSQQNTLVNCSDWAKGVYLVKITSEENSVTKKIILQ